MSEKEPHLAFEDIFFEQFTKDSGILSLFLSLKNSKQPLIDFDNTFDFWAKQKRSIVEEVIRISLDVNNEPEKYSEEHRFLYGSIHLEDYQINSNKGLLSLKRKIKDELKEFLDQVEQ